MVDVTLIREENETKEDQRKVTELLSEEFNSTERAMNMVDMVEL